MTAPVAFSRAWWMVAAALAAGLVVLLSPLQDQLSSAGRDAQLRALADPKTPAGVLVFDIDDASLALLKPLFGPWPYRRDVYALAAERLRELGAKAIALDVLLADERPGDDALARALARPGAPIVLAAAGVRQGIGDSPRLMQRAIAAGAPASGFSGGLQGSGVPVGMSWPSLVLPTASVWPAADRPPALGLITTHTDPDGVVRRLPLWADSGGVRWPLQPLAVLLAIGEAPSQRVVVDGSGSVHLAFPADRGWPLSLPFSALMLGNPSPPALESLRQQVAGRVVIIGSSALFADAALTVQGQVSGTRVLAHTFVALRDGQVVTPPSQAFHVLLVLIALLPITLATGMRWHRPRHAFGLTALAVLAIVTTGVWAHMTWRMPVLWAAPTITAVFGLGLLLLARHRAQVEAELRLQQELEVARRTSLAKRDFLAHVSHELRTPMNALLGVAELLSESDMTPTQRAHVQVFRSSGQSLLDLINDLLDLSRIESGRLDIESEPFSLHRLIDHLDGLLGSRATAKGLQWQIQRSPDLPNGMRGDRGRLEQALTNLLGNALKFTPRGSVRLDVQPGDGPDQVRFIVRDTGIGIAADRLAAIFQPFEQADRGITRQFGGTGLGLAITESLAKAMGGSITVESAPGSGSTFTLTVPLPAADLVPAIIESSLLAGTPLAAPASDAKPPSPGRRDVLLAEDNEINVYLFCAMLDGQGVVIDVARDGLEALDRLRDRHYDIAFVDVQMPGMDGLTVTRELRQHELATRRVRLPIVALTANAMPSDLEDSLAAGCDRHLAKPVGKAQLIATLRELTGPASSSSVRSAAR